MEVRQVEGQMDWELKEVESGKAGGKSDDRIRRLETQLMRLQTSVECGCQVCGCCLLLLAAV